MPVITGAVKYPEARAALPQALWVDALSLAEQAGNARCANVAMLGAASRYLPFSPSEWTEVITQSVPEKVAEMNVKAFELGCAV